VKPARKPAAPLHTVFPFHVGLPYRTRNGVVVRIENVRTGGVSVRCDLGMRHELSTKRWLSLDLAYAEEAEGTRRDQANPWLRTGGDPLKAVERRERVASFTVDQLKQAEKVPGLQASVEAAIASRLRAFAKAERDAERKKAKAREQAGDAVFGGIVAARVRLQRVPGLTLDQCRAALHARRIGSQNAVRDALLARIAELEGGAS
jgi:hypothetical protein